MENSTWPSAEEEREAHVTDDEAFLPPAFTSMNSFEGITCPCKYECICPLKEVGCFE